MIISEGFGLRWQLERRMLAGGAWYAKAQHLPIQLPVPSPHECSSTAMRHLLSTSTCSLPAGGAQHHRVVLRMPLHPHDALAPLRLRPHDLAPSACNPVSTALVLI